LPPPRSQYKPFEGWTWIPSQDPALRARVPIQINYGDQDFLVDPIRASVPYFVQMGFTTQENVYPGFGHCGGDPFEADPIAWFTTHLPAQP
jgi:alpha-beta hydrolase superfamily lysophospholipase